ncbi:hypothetical protein ACK8HX_14210, partial [Oryzobacter sp. R7]|uniref:hypothetical protein n=1 Tax=Oryzobacter faecalis TaxID=3388656 RepID=UPI00398C8826
MNSQHGQSADVMGAAVDHDVAAVLASMSTELAELTLRTAATREELACVVAAAQAVANAAAAVQDGAIAALAAVEGEWAEDGTITEVVRAPGHVAIDAADLL